MLPPMYLLPKGEGWIYSALCRAAIVGSRSVSKGVGVQYLEKLATPLPYRSGDFMNPPHLPSWDEAAVS